MDDMVMSVYRLTIELRNNEMSNTVSMKDTAKHIRYVASSLGIETDTYDLRYIDQKEKLVDRINQCIIVANDEDEVGELTLSEDEVSLDSVKEVSVVYWDYESKEGYIKLNGETRVIGFSRAIPSDEVNIFSSQNCFFVRQGDFAYLTGIDYWEDTGNVNFNNPNIVPNLDYIVYWTVPSKDTQIESITCRVLGSSLQREVGISSISLADNSPTMYAETKEMVVADTKERDGFIYYFPRKGLFTLVGQTWIDYSNNSCGSTKWIDVVQSVKKATVSVGAIVWCQDYYHIPLYRQPAFTVVSLNYQGVLLLARIKCIRGLPGVIVEGTEKITPIVCLQPTGIHEINEVGNEDDNII